MYRSSKDYLNTLNNFLSIPIFSNYSTKVTLKQVALQKAFKSPFSTMFETIFRGKTLRVLGCSGTGDSSPHRHFTIHLDKKITTFLNPCSSF